MTYRSMPPRHPHPVVRPPRPGVVVWSWIWAFLPALSLGLLGWVPILHAAVRLRERPLWLILAGYCVLTVGAFAGANAIPDVAGGTFVLLAVICTIHACLLRPRVFDPARRPLRLSPSAIEAEPAYAAAAPARQRREQARALAARDMAMARDLLIGRPDLPRHFDDGGLVDVNHMPAPAIAHHLGLDINAAAQMVQVRDQIGGYSYPEELTTLGGLPPETADWIRDRVIFLRF